MKKVLAWVILITLFGTAAGISQAVMPDQTQVVNTKANHEKPLIIPKNAVEVAPNIFSLGSAVDPATKKIVDGFMIVYKKQDARNQGVKKPGGNVCYGFLSAGAKWKTVESWIVNASNSAGISDTTILAIMQNNVSKWEDATDGTINGSASADIFGNGSLTNASLAADSSSPDNLNEVYFSSIADSNTIAVTTVWGIFRGPASNRELVEWDMVFDDAKYSWSTTGNASAMDFENISTHEMGHAVGLADIYTNACLDETMYGYASEGETNKRDLNTGDIQGVNTLY